MKNNQIEVSRALTLELHNKILPKSKRSQTTLFIIIALVIIAAGVLIYFLFPGVRTGLVSDEENPGNFIQTCLETNVEEIVDSLSKQGGSVRPEHYIVYEDSNIEYLCYTSDYYVPCVVQRPFLVSHISNEIEREINDEVGRCFDDLEAKYRDDGYNVNLRRGEFDVELLPKRVVLNFGSVLTLTKGDETTNYDRFRVVLNNNLYELASIATSITEWETKYGEAESTLYMTYYRDLKVEKKKQIEGSTIYILTDRNSGNKFQFASRSMAWPPGY